MSYYIRYGSIILLCISLMGCQFLINTPSDKIVVYELKSFAEPHVTGPDALAVLIDPPIVSRSLRTQDIIISQNENQLTRLKGGRWAESISVSVQASLIDSLAVSPHIVAILPESGARADYRVSLHIRRFDSQFQGLGTKPVAQVDYEVTLSSAATRQWLGNIRVQESHTAENAYMADIIAAQTHANYVAVEKITDWLETTLNVNDSDIENKK